jgi:DNA-binding transcriptional LysR family regulator
VTSCSRSSGRPSRTSAACCPPYFASHDPPASPPDLLRHQCIRFRHKGESVYKWELDKGDESLEIAVRGSLLLDELDLVIEAAVAGAGLAWVAEDRVVDHLASGSLIRALQDWCPPFPGFVLYYPTRKQQPGVLTALVKTLRLGAKGPS